MDAFAYAYNALCARLYEYTHKSSMGICVCLQAANYLRSVGVKKGDDVTIYMPMVPALPAIMVRGHCGCVDCKRYV